MKNLMIFLVCGMCWNGVLAQTTTLALMTNTGDSYVSSQNTSATAGSATTMNIGVTSGPFHTRGFVQFDLSSIPYGAVIVHARLKFTPNGSEGADITNSSFVVEPVAGSWSESTVSYASNPGIHTYPSIATSSLVGGKRRFDIHFLVHQMVSNGMPNHGWRIRRNNETTVTAGSSYHTKEAATSTDRPELEVRYFMPYEITAAAITHATSLTNTDGGISPTISGGPSGAVSYQWYDGNGNALATTQALTNVGYGWYGLKITSANPAHSYQYAFLVGVENQAVNIKFKADREYSEEAMVYNRNAGALDYANVNNPNYATYFAADWGTTGDWYNSRFLVKYNLWMDPAFTVNQSDLHLFGVDHSSSLRANPAEFRKVTQAWRETWPTFNNAPTTTTAITKTVPGTSTTTQNSTIDLNDFWNDWKTSNTTNYGLDFQLSLYNGVGAKQRYHAASVADTSKRPYIQFNVELGYQENLASLGYYELKDEFDGGYAKTYDGILKISFTEEYQIASGKYLPLKIYDMSHALQGMVDLDGNITGTGTPALPYHFNDNRHQIDLSALSLTNDALYVLEVTTSTGEERYLKFMYRD